jgi:hypothetical protein
LKRLHRLSLPKHLLLSRLLKLPKWLPRWSRSARWWKQVAASEAVIAEVAAVTDVPAQAEVVAAAVTEVVVEQAAVAEAQVQIQTQVQPQAEAALPADLGGLVMVATKAVSVAGFRRWKCRQARAVVTWYVRQKSSMWLSS